MNESQADWLPEPMQENIFGDVALDGAENVVSFPRRPNPLKIPGSIALDLIHRAAELFEEVNDHASERLARAEQLAKEAIEDLKIAHDRVQSAEAGRLAAESEFRDFRDRIDEELCVRLQVIEKIMERAASRVAATNAQLSAVEQRARLAETRATQAENALKRIEEAIQTQILEKRPLDYSGRSVAA